MLHWGSVLLKKLYVMRRDGLLKRCSNALKRLSHKGVSLNPFAWHSNFYVTFNHLHGMYMRLEWLANEISWKHSNCSIRKVLEKPLHKFLGIKS